MKPADLIFIVAVLLVLLSSSLSRQQQPVQLVDNPAYPGFLTFAEAHALDVSPYQKLKPGWKFEPTELPLFDQTLGDLDVLLVGDSSVNYGLAPGIIEQISGLKTGVLAYPALRFNEPMSEYIDYVARQHVRSDGLVVMMFDPGFWNNQDTDQQNQQLNQLIQSQHLPACDFCMKTYRAHEAARKKSAWMGYIDDHFGLRSQPFYATYIEPWVAPKQARKKFRNDQGLTKQEQRFFLSPGHILIHMEEPQWSDAEVITQPAPLGPIARQILQSKLQRIQHQKVVVVPFTQTPQIHANLLTITESMPEDISVININLLRPRHWRVPMQNRTHTANEGVLQQSYLLGSALKQLMQPKSFTAEE